MRPLLLLGLLAGCTWIDAEDIATRTDPDGDGLSGGDDCAPDDASVGDPLTWYIDDDGDGHGDPNAPIQACEAPDGAVAEADDCDDGDKATAPGAAEVCDDGVVNDCDGTEAAAWQECGWSGSLDIEDGADVLYGRDDGDHVGVSVSDGGDLDGDGATDLVVGGPGRDTLSGAVWVVSGLPEGQQALSEVGVELDGEYGHMAGFSTAGLGDLDGDGYGELLVGAPERASLDGGDCGHGDVWLISGPPQAGALQDLAATAWPGEDAGCIGHSVAAVGDLNGDGLSELLMGEPGLGNGEFQGRAWLVHGATALGDEPAGALLVGKQGSLAGYAVTGPGDLDGDGTPDLVVGAPGTTDARVYVLTAISGATVTLEDEAWIITNEDADDKLGAEVVGAGDLDGDGYGDLLAGARVNDTGGTNAGAAYVLAGPIDASSTVVYARTRLYGVADDDEVGRSLAALGDLDGDGRGEIAVGAPGHDERGLDAGGVYIVSGQAEGAMALDSAMATLLHSQQDAALGRDLAVMRDAQGEVRLVIGAEGLNTPDGGPENTGGALLLPLPRW